MPITKSLLGPFITFGLFAGLSTVSGISMEHLALATFLLLALCGGGFVFWRRHQDKANIGIVHHLVGWVLPLIGVAVAYALS